MRVLVIFPGALGDLILAGPAIRAITRRHSDAPVDLMARGELARFAVGRMGIAGAHSIDRREMSALFRDGGGVDSEAHNFFGRFDRIYSFFAADDQNYRRALVGSTSGQVSFHQFRPPGEGPLGIQYIESVGAGADSVESRIDLLPVDLNDAKGALRRVAVTGRYLAIFPGSGSAAKNWPLDRFIGVGQELAAIVQPVAVLGPAEEEAEGTLARSGISCLTRLQLGTVAAVAHLSCGFIGNDSGVSHLAAASGSRGVVLFGHTDPLRWRPLGDVAVIRKQPLEALTVAEVSSALRSIVASHG